MVEQDILNAAMKVFVQKGKDGARMQEIADMVGVNKMLLHYYYKNKEMLFGEVVKKIVVDLYSSVIEESISSATLKSFLLCSLTDIRIFGIKRRSPEGKGPVGFSMLYVFPP